MRELIDNLKSICGEANVMVEEPLANHTTFKIGGPADVLVEPASTGEICGVLAACKQAGVAVRFLGFGSNVLASDEGVRGVVLKLAERFSAVTVLRADDAQGADDATAADDVQGADDAAAADDAQGAGNQSASTLGTQLVCQAGASNEKVAAAAQAAGLAGYEFASGIPGGIGGAAIMNAGAYGGEFADVAVSVQCLTPEGDVVTVSREEADWGYRRSMMAQRGWLVLGATLQLTPDSPAAIQERMDDLRKRREDKQPLEMPSAGSTFKRPEGYFAGKLIQDAGLMGYQVGGAQVSTKHAGFVVNAGGATAADVLQLIRDVQDRVMANDGVLLEPEVRLWQ